MSPLRFVCRFRQVYDSDSWSSWWLNLHRLNIFVACYASKALGLIPLFEIGFEMDWKSQCRRLVSRLYHWLLILFLLCAVARLAIPVMEVCV